MVPVVSERHLDPPIQITDVSAMETEAAWCREQYRVSHVISLLSLDGRRLVCLFDAPDAEAVRNVLRRLDAPFERAWTASIHAPPSHPVTASLAAAAQALVVVERSFAEPADFAAIQAIEDRGAWCLDQHRVRALRTYFSIDRRRMISAYAAPDAESVHLAQTQAGMPFERVWTATPYETSA
jgi:hypothetical protein